MTRANEEEVERGGVSAEYRLRCERVHQQALIAVARRHGRDADMPRLVERLAVVERQLAEVGEGRAARIAARLGLSRVQVEVLWAAVAVTADARVAPHAEALAGPHARRGLSLGLYAELAGLDDVTVHGLARWLAGPCPLIDAGLLIVAEEQASVAARPHAVPARVIAYLAGDEAPDRELAIVDAGATALVHDESQATALVALARTLSPDAEVVTVVEGPRGSGRRTAVARAAGAPAIVLDVAGRTATEVERGLRALGRELVLRDGVPVIADADAADGDDARRAIARFVAAHRGPLAITCGRGGIDLGGETPVVRVRWGTPDVATRRRLWERALGDGAGLDLDAIAQRFPLGPAAIRRAVVSARAQGAAAPGVDALIRGVRHNVAERLGGLAERVDVRQTWDDVVLADDTREQIDALIARLRHAHHVLEAWQYRGKLARGHGVPVLFSGPPGTGKTMVAGLIARELGLELYQVDLSQVVSKWIGETEKHLGRLFDAAEEGHALLLFDEADALFGQRTTDVKGAVDRYANLEVNYLLQRVESFGGVTILTTNLEASIDRALKRRLAAHVVFDAPDEDERVRLWQRLTATETAPLAADVDVEYLARTFATMSGANIRNAALSAAFLAAADGGGTIRQEHLVRAARAEYRSMGHVLSDRGTLGAREPR